MQERLARTRQPQNVTRAEAAEQSPSSRTRLHVNVTWLLLICVLYGDSHSRNLYTRNLHRIERSSIRCRFLVPVRVSSACVTPIICARLCCSHERNGSLAMERVSRFDFKLVHFKRHALWPRSWSKCYVIIIVVVIIIIISTSLNNSFSFRPSYYNAPLFLSSPSASSFRYA